MSHLAKAIAQVADGHDLTVEAARAAFDTIMQGGASPAQMGAFLMGLRVKGETVAEITGAVSVMRAYMLKVEAPEGAIDLVGTGGDGVGTYNISTTAAILVAACGVRVAKHGNRSVSSKSGAADVLTALGVDIELRPEQIGDCIHKAGLGFMFAPAHHSAMRHVVPARKELAIRTIFNILGPLSNPANVKRAVIGVYSPLWLEPIAETLRDLGMERAWIVHGDGLDELTTVGESEVVSLKDGALKRFTLTPESVGIERAKLTDLQGGDAEVNAAALREVLAGKPSAYADIARLNAAAGLLVGGACERLEAGLAMIDAAISEGKAEATLAKLAAISNEGEPK